MACLYSPALPHHHTQSVHRAALPLCILHMNEYEYALKQEQRQQQQQQISIM